LIESDDAEANGLKEMVLILVQIGNEPSLRLLSAIDRERGDTVRSILEGLAARIGISITELRRRLTLSED